MAVRRVCSCSNPLSLRYPKCTSRSRGSASSSRPSALYVFERLACATSRFLADNNGRHEQHRNRGDFRARPRPIIVVLASSSGRGDAPPPAKPASAPPLDRDRGRRRPSSSRVSWPAPPGRCWASGAKRSRPLAGSSSARRGTPSRSRGEKGRARTSTRRTGGAAAPSSPRATFDEGARAHRTPRRSSSRARARTRRRGARSGAARRHRLYTIVK